MRSSRQPQQHDRMTPFLSQQEKELANIHLTTALPVASNKFQENYNNQLANELFGCPLNSGSSTRSIFAKVKPVKNLPQTSITRKKTVSIEMEKILRVTEEAVNDFYLSPLSWGNEELIYLALKNKIYLYQHQIKKIVVGMECEEDRHFTAMLPLQGNTSWYASDNGGRLYINDVVASGQTFEASMECHVPINKFEPSDFPLVFFGANKLNSTFCFDRRVPTAIFATLSQNHEKPGTQVCGLSFNGDNKLATGSDGKILVWDMRQLEKPLTEMLQHKATVKALQFHPGDKNKIASGGGAAEPVIRVWDINTQQIFFEANAEERVSSVQWVSDRHLLSTQETYEMNRAPIKLWDVSQPKESPVLETLNGMDFEDERMLGSVKAPKSNHVATLSTDSVVRFWKFNVEKNQTNKSEAKMQNKNLSPLFIR